MPAPADARNGPAEIVSTQSVFMSVAAVAVHRVLHDVADLAAAQRERHHRLEPPVPERPVALANPASA